MEGCRKLILSSVLLFGVLSVSTADVTTNCKCTLAVRCASGNIVRNTLHTCPKGQVCCTATVQEVQDTKIHNIGVKEDRKAQDTKIPTISAKEDRGVKEDRKVPLALQNITRSFTVHRPKIRERKTTFESKEEYLLGDTKWKLCLSRKRVPDVARYWVMYIKCSSDVKKDLECTAQIQLKMIPVSSKEEALFLPDKSSYATVTVRSDGTCVEVGSYDWDKVVPYGHTNLSWDEGYVKNYNKTDESTHDFNFEAHFKSIECK
ncbi:uncharacterized protein LOC103509106 [Diaphorina citri]|uniref:Uncharacterized protein LOC103509106 n=1 Tax=Diaphorina citri TaxID=121845 RepID=A0A1S3D0X8_DIACI|nr:uncharacterized protein LOC103509106 [Diaphorina citri]